MFSTRIISIATILLVACAGIQAQDSSSDVSPCPSASTVTETHRPTITVFSEQPTGSNERRDLHPHAILDKRAQTVTVTRTATRTATSTTVVTSTRTASTSTEVQTSTITNTYTARRTSTVTETSTATATSTRSTTSTTTSTATVSSTRYFTNTETVFATRTVTVNQRRALPTAAKEMA